MFAKKSLFSFFFLTGAIAVRFASFSYLHGKNLFWNFGIGRKGLQSVGYWCEVDWNVFFFSALISKSWFYLSVEKKNENWHC